MIRFISTGGTIDCHAVDTDGHYTFQESFLKDMLALGRYTSSLVHQVLFMKDSLYMTDSDRQMVLDASQAAPEERIVITHGTDTICETARVLGEAVIAKTIVLVGAIVPYRQPQSDALFNVGSAISAVRILPHGVYITMNGQVFRWDNVRKNREFGFFETLRSEA